jgi:hypothetical protein
MGLRGALASFTGVGGGETGRCFFTRSSPPGMLKTFTSPAIFVQQARRRQPPSARIRTMSERGPAAQGALSSIQHIHVVQSP